MKTNNSDKIQLCYVFLSICRENEINKLIEIIFSLFSKEEFDEIINSLPKRDKFIKKANPEKLSNNQKILILTYSHLYFSYHDISLQNPDLSFLLKSFNINKKFSDTFHDFFNEETIKNLIDKRTPIENIFEPTARTLHFVTNFIYFIFQNGSFIEKQILYDLNNREYEHELDRKALMALEGTPGLEKVVRFFNKYGLERFIKIQYTGSNIKVTKTNFPMLHKMLLEACNVLAIDKIPDLYIELGFINAKIMGVEKPIIVLTSGCIGLLTFDELLFIIGHELGHIKSEHVLYHQMSEVLPILGAVIGNATLGIGGLVATGIQIALLNWRRKSEFTADRAGLLVCQNIDSAITAMMKLAGLPPKYYKIANTDDFIQQAKEFEDFDFNQFDKAAKVLSVMGATHPWTVMRAAEMNKWIDSGNYTNIIERHAKKKSNPDNIFCVNCGKKIKKGQPFCNFCGCKL